MKALARVLCLGVGCLLFAGCSNSTTTGSSKGGSGPGKDAGASEAETAAADWLYPGAKVVHSGHVGAVSCVVQETADDVARALKHYKDKLGIELREESAIQTGGAKPSAGGGPVEYAHVGRKAAGGTATVSTFKTKTAVATVVISRPQDGKVTTITITHVLQGAAK
jgi:hypothetical protein